MGNDTEFKASFRQEMGNDTIQDTSIFKEKQEKQGKTGKTGERTLKNRKKQEKPGKNRKLLEIQKQDFDEVPGNAENGNKFRNEFGNEFKNEFGNKFEVFSNSRNDDSRAKTIHRPTPN